MDKKKRKFDKMMEEYGRHFSYIREVCKGRCYEVVAARQDSENTMEFLHTFIDLADYSDKEIQDILLRSANQALKQFIKEAAPGKVLVEDYRGRIDRAMSEAWDEAAPLLISHVMETVVGRSVSRTRAYELIQAITGDDPASRWDFPNPA